MPSILRNSGGGGRVGEEAQIPTKERFRVRYTENGSEPVLMRCKGDPFEVCNFARSRIFHDQAIPQFDAKFAAVMAGRK